MSLIQITSVYIRVYNFIFLITFPFICFYLITVEKIEYLNFYIY